MVFLFVLIFLVYLEWLVLTHEAATTQEPFWILVTATTTVALAIALFAGLVLLHQLRWRTKFGDTVEPGAWRTWLQKLRQRRYVASIVAFSLLFLTLPMLWSNPEGVTDVEPTEVAVSASPAAADPVPASLPAPQPVATAGKPVVMPIAEPKADPAKGVQEAVRAWAHAWEQGLADQYLAMYSPNFVPANGTPRKTWEQTRRQRISNARDIKITISDLTITAIGSQQASVLFVQDYSSRDLKDVSRKSLTLERVGNQWRLQAETAEPIRGRRAPVQRQ